MNAKLQIFGISTAFIITFIFVYSIYTQIKEDHDSSDPILKDIRSELSKVHPIANELEFYKGDKSYTINKEKVYLCLKDNKGEYYDMNTLMYVALHEVAHALNDEVGHTDKFHKIFDKLLDEAADKGVFNPSIPIPSNYCEY